MYKEDHLLKRVINSQFNPAGAKSEINSKEIKVETAGYRTREQILKPLMSQGRHLADLRRLAYNDRNFDFNTVNEKQLDELGFELRKLEFDPAELTNLTERLYDLNRRFAMAKRGIQPKTVESKTTETDPKE